jgi:hypothetical protein
MTFRSDYSVHFGVAASRISGASDFCKRRHLLHLAHGSQVASPGDLHQLLIGIAARNYSAKRQG